MTPSKLSGEERRAAIVQAVQRVFADKGFHGATTRELAQAAGVSEALLFKHFPTKEALYSALLPTCQAALPASVAAKLAEGPSTESLVMMVHSFVAKSIGSADCPYDDRSVQTRLLFRSLMEDGEFARLFLQNLAAHWIPRVEACWAAAVASGDVAPGPVNARMGLWLTQHLASSLVLYYRPGGASPDDATPREQLIEQSVAFALRGLGLSDAALARCYTAEAIASWS